MDKENVTFPCMRTTIPASPGAVRFFALEVWEHDANTVYLHQSGAALAVDVAQVPALVQTLREWLMEIGAKDTA